ncbi:hypothetical protein [Amycolatopsis sp. NPDC059657]|uniref:hypothetical protein n=1 Tax=Amycolatopsis sp. NPDC059657 TaxID=3346899 RepID=UPI00366B7F2C
MNKMVMRAALFFSVAMSLVFGGGLASAASVSPANSAGVESYFRYGVYNGYEECSVYGVAYDAANPRSTGWYCVSEGGNRYALYVDDGITD